MSGLEFLAFVPHPMSEQWMLWKPIASAPTHGKQILVGFEGQFEWFSYVANAMGDLTGQHMQFAKPTHWMPIIPPGDSKGNDDGQG